MIRNLPSKRQGLQGRGNGVWEEVIATIPQERGDTLLEVALMHHGASCTDVELRTMIWGNGLGWYCQSTLILDQATARRLLSALSSVRRRLDPTGDAKRESREETKMIPFPDGRKRSTDAERTPTLMAR